MDFEQCPPTAQQALGVEVSSLRISQDIFTFFCSNIEGRCLIGFDWYFHVFMYFLDDLLHLWPYWKTFTAVILIHFS